MTTPDTGAWREFLGTLIDTAEDRDRIAREAGLSPITLQRWRRNEAKPKPENLFQLLNVLPAETRKQLHELILSEFPYFPQMEVAVSSATALNAEGGLPIPHEFLLRVLAAHETSAHTQHTWSICTLVLDQMLTQLDPDGSGISITVFLCQPAPDGRTIHCLRGSSNVGTLPWHNDVIPTPLFRGLETLEGYVTLSGRTFSIPDVQAETSYLPVSQIDAAGSLVVCPLLRADRIVGCFRIISTQKHYFTPVRLRSIQVYRMLLALAFFDDAFYDRAALKLRVMPPAEVQRTYLATFRDRVTALMNEASERHETLDLLQVEQTVWRQIADELAQYPVASGTGEE